MKILSLMNCALVLIGLAGSAQAQTAPAEPAHQTSSTLVLAHCDQHSAQPCGLAQNASTPGDKNDDAEALPANDPKRAQEVEPVAQIPEPQTFIMLMLGLVVLGFASRRSSATEKFSD